MGARFSEVMRYFFDIYNTIDVIDDEGSELASDEAAILRATESARSLAAEEVLNGTLHLCHCIVVRDAEGRRLASVRFGDAIEIVP